MQNSLDSNLETRKTEQVWNYDKLDINDFSYTIKPNLIYIYYINYNVSNFSGLKKTKICNNVIFDPKIGNYYGPCKYGEFCMFAHNLEELNQPRNY